MDLNAGMPGQPAPGLCSGAGRRFRIFSKVFLGGSARGALEATASGRSPRWRGANPLIPGSSGRSQHELVESWGRPLAQIARELGIAHGTLSAWVKQAELDAGLRSDGLRGAREGASQGDPDVPGAGRLPQWVLRVAQARAEPQTAGGCSAWTADSGIGAHGPAHHPPMPLNLPALPCPRKRGKSAHSLACRVGRLFVMFNNCT